MSVFSAPCRSGGGSEVPSRSCCPSQNGSLRSCSCLATPGPRKRTRSGPGRIRDSGASPSIDRDVEADVVLRRRIRSNPVNPHVLGAVAAPPCNPANPLDGLPLLRPLQDPIDVDLPSVVNRPEGVLSEV